MNKKIEDLRLAAIAARKAADTANGIAVSAAAAATSTYTAATAAIALGGGAAFAAADALVNAFVDADTRKTAVTLSDFINTTADARREAHREARRAACRNESVAALDSFNALNVLNTRKANGTTYAISAAAAYTAANRAALDAARAAATADAAYLSASITLADD